MLELEVFIVGARRQIAVIVEKNRSQCRDYINSLDKRERDKLFVIMNRMAGNREIINKELFRYLGDKVFEFKAGLARVFCFIYENLIICTHGTRKPGRRQLIKEIKKSAKLRKRFIEQEESLDEN